jgi:capsular exopolysaccharide synthesis family protein
MNILLGLVLGLCGGIGLAFFIEYLDNTIKTPEEAEERLGLPLLGVIDRCKFGKEGEVGQELISLYEKHSANVESFKALRTSVLLSSSDKPPESIVVTSMMPGEGKSTISSNLAITIAQAGQRVLLIDGDMRKPRLHKIFKLDSSLGGLSTYLAGVASIAKICQQGPLASLTIIPAGPTPPNPSELLSSDRLKELLRNEQGKYDIIIFDSAPIITVTDSLIISRLVDGVIVVTQAAATNYDVVRKGLKSLSDIKANILGMVINGFDVKKYRYYYGTEYSRYYGKYYGTQES